MAEEVHAENALCKIPQGAEIEAQELEVAELELWKSVPEALHLDLRLLEEETRDDHWNGVEDCVGMEDVRDAVVHEAAELEYCDR